MIVAFPSQTPLASSETADILIVGGGMVGCALAVALADAGMSVVCVDREEPAAVLAAGFDGRASAIALSSRRALDGIGAWPLSADDVQPIHDIRVSEKDSPFFLHYDSERLGGEPFGYMVENRIIRRTLLARMEETANLRHAAPDRVEALFRNPSGVEARLASGTVVRAALAVAADGRGSDCRTEAGIRLTGWDYGQVGIVCTVVHEKPHGGIAHEHFLPVGPFAILPLPGDRSSIVWTERADLGPAIMALDDASFTAELARRFGDFLGDLEVVGPRWSYPLSLQFAERSIAERLALVGDAVHALHPIAGQGLNMGLRDAAALAEVLVDARRLGLDIGAGNVLEDYECWRRFDNTLMLAMTDGLNRLFSNDIGPIKLARDLGLAAVDQIPPLKRLFTRQAMGLTGDLPRLLQGQPL